LGTQARNQGWSWDLGFSSKEKVADIMEVNYNINRERIYTVCREEE
jgi:hypothetical protein